MSAETERLLAAARAGERLGGAQLLRLAETASSNALHQAAAEIRDRGHPELVTYSRKVFIPLTRLCRDVCHYCTFATTPRRLAKAYLSIGEVLEIARRGAEAGCKEALFTLGDRPERRYPAARRSLEEMGHDSTVSYLRQAAAAVLKETGLLPHMNAGVLNEDELRALKEVSVSQGMMLECVSPRLCAPAGAHHGSPDKQPAVRLKCLHAAGRVAVPFTSGILIGIGETLKERILSLLALRAAADRHGHVQEIIVQPFRAKPDTKMAGAREPRDDELLRTVALARIAFGPEANIQAPPNLTPGAVAKLIDAGISDFGGISPVTPDHVNPEYPWPHLRQLERDTASAGKVLAERLALYPAYAAERERWVEPALHGALLAQLGGDGLARSCAWEAGMGGTGELIPGAGSGSTRTGGGVAAILTKTERGELLSEADIAGLFRARGGALADILAFADARRRAAVGETVTYVVNRNINYSNICTYRCQFCAFSKGRVAEALRDPPYVLPLEEIVSRAREAVRRGATEVCLQGAIHPSYDGNTYLTICRAVKEACPELHIHAFSPLEISHGAQSLGLPVERFLGQLQQAGLGSLPGTAAEILHDDVRSVICPDKIGTDAWLEVMRAAHGLGIPTTATIMFGHVDGYQHWARHLVLIRDLQRQTGGFTEFVPLPFVAREAPIFKKGRARRGPTYREAVLMHALARIVLDGVIDNIQASWVKMGPDGLKDCLNAGANDMGGTLMNESITRAAGARHGQEFAASDMAQLARTIDRPLAQRTTLYALGSAHAA